MGKKTTTDDALTMALHQLIGFGHKSRGYSLIMLVESMGLTEQEWNTIRKDVLYLSPGEIQEIDDHFDSLKNKQK